ncbi:MAG: DUF5119 domain-containing protein [Rikenellaceae bacterium]
MNIRRFIISLPLLLSLVVSCVRQDLEEIFYSKALIPVLIDWETKALMYVDNDPNNDLYSASLWLFPTANSTYQGAPLEYKLTDPEHDYIDVPVGEYDVLVFNKTVGDYSSNVGFRGTDSFETFEYYTNPSSKATLFSSVCEGETFSSEPDLLAAWTFADGETLKVTYNEIVWYEKIEDVRSRTKSSSTKVTEEDFSELPDELKQLIYIVPERLVHKVFIKERLTNLQAASAAQANFRGSSSSVLLASRSYSTETIPYVVTFSEKYYDYFDDSCRDLMVGSSNVIGPLYQESNYSVETIFSLTGTYEGSSTYPASPSTGLYFDASYQVNNAEIDLDKYFTIWICYCGGDGEGDDDEDTPTIPDIDDDDDDYEESHGSDGAFDVGVNSWDDPIVIPL